MSVLGMAPWPRNPALLPRMADGAMVADDGVSLSIVTSEPAAVLAALADRRALGGLQVRGGTLEDVFLRLTGREYRS